MSRRWNFAARPFQDDRPVLVATAALVVFGAALLVANLRLFTEYRREVADTRAEVAALEDRKVRADKKAEAAKTALSSYKLSALADESRALARIVAERRFSWTTLLARLERTLPPEVGLSHLQPHFEKDGEVSLDMLLYARNRDAVVKTIAALGKDPIFDGVDVKSESVGEPGSPDPVQFTLAARYEPAAAYAAPAEPRGAPGKGKKR